MKNLVLILVVLSLFPAFAIGREISGAVTDETGTAIPGVSIVADKSKLGTMSDVSGQYKLSLSADDAYLVFSYVGMETQKVKIDGRSVVNVTMQNAKVALEECIVMGYGTEKKSRLCGAVSGVRIQRRNVFAFADQEWGTENYATVHENGYKDVNANPLSTFSIDVDNASYANMRRFINEGQVPPIDAVRVEEMINYFKYDYPEPKGEHPFSISTELAACPWQPDHYLFRVGLKGKSIDKAELPATNLVFLIDVSGSMADDNKLPLLKRAFTMLVNELRPQDRVSIVVYAGAAGLVLDSSPGNNKTKIHDALSQLQSGGSTAGGEGLKLAYAVANKNFIKGGNNRIILATDGDFNVGVSSTSEMERLVEKERESGIFMSVLGFGTGNIKDDRMETIADKGNGNYAYIDNIQEARRVLISQFGGTLFTIAKDVKFQLEFNPQQVKSYRLVGYENRLLNDEDFNDDTKDAGEMGEGHTVTALYELVPAYSRTRVPKVDPLKYQKLEPIGADFYQELLTVKLRYKSPDGGKSKLMEQAVPCKLEDETSDDFRFSAAVASFGMLLRNSEFKGNSTLDSLIKQAQNARGTDEDGYRAEFIRLAQSVNDLNLLAKD
ncbi:MAG: von Willebrand factor type A domain-containing protein [Mangrovibacterium sp.]